MFGRSKLDTNTRAAASSSRCRISRARVRVGGGGERDARHAGKRVAQHRELQVLGPEVVAPLRHAVRLVDRKERELRAGEKLQRTRRQQTLGRDVQQVELARHERALDRAAPRGAESVELRNAARTPSLAEGRDLVLHQRDERRDDDAGAGRSSAGIW